MNTGRGKKNRLLSKADILLAAVLMAASLFVSFVYYLGRGEAQILTVSVNGEVIAQYDLRSDTLKEERIEGYDGGYNLLTIQDGAAFLTEADCPDHLCVKQGKIQRNGETIVCLPHRLVIEVKGGADADVDAVVN